MLKIPESVYNQLRCHGETTYPNECCGILIGHADSPEGSLVTEAISTENAAESARNRYQIAPIDLIRIERNARAQNLAIIGFYHSHPDNPAEPSATDLAEAHWLGYSYLITSVQNGIATDTHSFLLTGTSEEDKRLDTEEIRLTKL
jgi:proteasome lid subunit RPN8/RPN11